MVVIFIGIVCALCAGWSVAMYLALRWRDQCLTWRWIAERKLDASFSPCYLPHLRHAMKRAVRDPERFAATFALIVAGDFRTACELNDD